MTAARRGASAWLAALVVASLVWSGLILLAPAWLAPGSGRAALTTRATLAGVTYLVAARVCHQRPDRSFHLHGQPLPVCGRCAGLYLSGTAGLFAGLALRRRDRRPSVSTGAGRAAALSPRVIWLAAAALPTALTWSLEMSGLWNPGTPLRGLAAVPLGLVTGVFIAARRS